MTHLQSGPYDDTLSFRLDPWFTIYMDWKSFQHGNFQLQKLQRATTFYLLLMKRIHNSYLKTKPLTEEKSKNTHLKPHYAEKTTSKTDSHSRTREAFNSYVSALSDTYGAADATRDSTHVRDTVNSDDLEQAIPVVRWAKIIVPLLSPSVSAWGPAVVHKKRELELYNGHDLSYHSSVEIRWDTD